MNLIAMFEKTKFFMQLPQYGKLLIRLYRDARVPLWIKLAGIGAAATIVSPLDPFADIPFLNVLDDAALLMLAARVFFMLIPAGVLAEHRAAVGLDQASLSMRNVTPR